VTRSSPVMCHRFFRHGLIGTAAVLIAAATPISASAAVSQGPAITNAVAAELHRDALFYAAEQSFQDKLRVGRERYNQKQIYRGKVIAAMAAELQARQLTVAVHQAADSENMTDQPVSGMGPSLLLGALAVGVLGFACYMNRLKPTLRAPRPR
jgi:hypothetical protein